MTERGGKTIPIRSMKERKWATIPVDQIVVVNSRDRDQRQFDDNVKSIGAIGLLKPIVVNAKFLDRSGKYELVCGEGRLLAHRRLGKTEIEAEVVNVDRKQAHLMSLVENIARVPPGTMWFANEVRRMHDAGVSITEIARIIGKSDSYVAAYVRLARDGEDRLIRGVEKGLFSMTFALRVVEADSPEMQHILMDAYDSDLITTSSFTQVKKILGARMDRRIRDRSHETPSANLGQHGGYTIAQLKRDIARVTDEKETYVREAERKENRVFAIIGALEVLMKDASFMALLQAEGLAERPQLAGTYTGWQNTTEKAQGEKPNDEERRDQGP